MSKLPDFKLETYMSRWEFNSRYHMTASDVETLTLTELLDMADPTDRAAWDNLRLGYIETFGTPALRQAVAETYDNLSADDILAFAGIEEGIFAAMQVLLERNDHAIIVTPNYQSAETIPLSICAADGIALDPTNGWSLDLEELRRKLRPNTKLIYVNFPHNPTGKIISKNQFAELIELCRSRGIYLLSDEVYRGLERDVERQLPQAADLYERGLSINVMSKAYGLPGLRVGWIGCRDRELLSRLERAKHYLSICNASPSEHLAVIALKARDRILTRNRELLATNLKSMNAFFDEFGDLFDWSIPDGGCIAYPRYKGQEGVETFCRRLAEEDGIILLPASIYQSSLGETPTDRFRIGFGRSYTIEGLSAMRASLMRNRP
jgi:aspartate/methionine/tyrosine aminotransferase